jgi:hypothetical protein
MMRGDFIIAVMIIDSRLRSVLSVIFTKSQFDNNILFAVNLLMLMHHWMALGRLSANVDEIGMPEDW